MFSPCVPPRGKGSANRGAASAVGELEQRFTGGSNGGGLLEQTAALVAQQRLLAESMERVSKVVLGLLELEPASSSLSNPVALLQMKAVSALASVFRHCADIREVLMRDLTELLLRPTDRDPAATFPCAGCPNSPPRAP